MMSANFLLLPTIIVLIGSVVTAIMAAMDIKEKMKHLAYTASGFLIFALLLLAVNFDDIVSIIPYKDYVANLIRYDTFANYFQLLLSAGALLTILISKHYVETHAFFKPEYFALILFSLFGMMMLSVSNELITAYVSLEIASMSIYSMIAFSTNSKRRVEAMYKYLVLGAFMGGFFLLGAALIYLQVGSTNIFDIASFLNNNSYEQTGLVVIGAVLVIGVFLFKIGAFPFQNWTLDVYYGAPMPITAFMASTFKVAVFSFFIRLFMEAFDTILDVWDTLFYIIIIATLFYGTFLALSQKSVKRMLISSSIVHSGYLLMAFLSMHNNPKEAAASVMFYLFAYFLSALGSFGLISYLALKDNHLRISYDDFKGLASERPYMAAMMTIFMFSLAGIPSTIGFIGKFYVFTATIQAGYASLAILGILATFVSIYYYFKLVAVMYFYPTPSMRELPPLEALTPIIIGLIAILIIWGGIGTGLAFFLPFPGVDVLMEVAKECISSLHL
jgi:NADH-quinone oxidoreductase subunit N